MQAPGPGLRGWAVPGLLGKPLLGWERSCSEAWLGRILMVSVTFIRAALCASLT